MSEYVINKKQYSGEEISSISRIEFALRFIQDERPKKLFKYFPNTINEDKRNFSLEALKNNTVHLQNPLCFDDPYDSTLYFEPDLFIIKRIGYYANLCGLKVNPQWDYSKTLHELANYLYLQLCDANKLENLFFCRGRDEDVVCLRHERFFNTLLQELNANRDRKDVWQLALSQAIHSEYIEVKEFLKSFRVSCFTTTPYSMLMWSHYANYHKGFCVEYEIPNYTKENATIFNNLFPVIYSENRTSVLPDCLNSLANQSLTDEELWNMYKYGLLTKSLDWKYQDEWRLISYDKMLSQDSDYNCRFFDIKKVYLGARMDKAERLEIINLCKDRIPYVGVLPDTIRFQMIDCSDKCGECKKVIK